MKKLNLTDKLNLDDLLDRFEDRAISKEKVESTINFYKEHNFDVTQYEMRVSGINSSRRTLRYKSKRAYNEENR